MKTQNPSMLRIAFNAFVFATHDIFNTRRLHL